MIPPWDAHQSPLHAHVLAITIQPCHQMTFHPPPPLMANCMKPTSEHQREEIARGRNSIPYESNQKGGKKKGKRNRRQEKRLDSLFPFTTFLFPFSSAARRSPLYSFPEASLPPTPRPRRPRRPRRPGTTTPARPAIPTFQRLKKKKK